MNMARTRIGLICGGLVLAGVAGCGETGGGSADDGAPERSSGRRPSKAAGSREPRADAGGPGPTMAIHRIQGRSHRSPRVGQWVRRVGGVVTAVERYGFYLQAPAEQWDDDPATSEALFVYTASPPTVSVRDRVRVTGRVHERVPGGSSSGNLSTTQLNDVEVQLLGTDAPLPPPVVVGQAGRLPPAADVAGGHEGNVSRSGVFRPDAVALDFYESLEGMRVRVDDAVVVGPLGWHERLPVVGDGGRHAGPRTRAGGVRRAPGDPNPERLMVHGLGAASGGQPPAHAKVGDRFEGPIAGVLGYRYGFYEVRVSSAGPALAPDGPPPKPPTKLAGDEDHVTVATFNAENLGPGDPSHVEAVARVIAGSLGAPDVVALQEVQDGNGSARGELSAEATHAALCEAIARAGGPAYRALDIAPASEGADGGQPGTNIRVAFLYRSDRIGFAPRGEPDPTTEGRLDDAPGGGVRLHPNPARIDPEHPAWTASRKPLVAELSFRGRPFFVVNVHFASKRGDAPLFGALQPPPTPTAGQRLAQARVVRRFVERLMARVPRARVVVLGDMNAFAHSSPVRTMVEGGLVSGLAQLPDDDRYTYVYRGNAQALDHLLVSEPWAQAGFEVDALHLHAGFPPAGRASDHDPLLARLPMN